MRAGQLDHYVLIEQPTETTDAYGQAVKSWATYVDAWAGIAPLRGSERILAGQEAAGADTKITMRYVSGVTAKMRVNEDGTLYDIKFVSDVRKQGEMMELLCVEGLSDG